MSRTDLSRRLSTLDAPGTTYSVYMTRRGRESGVRRAFSKQRDRRCEAVQKVARADGADLACAEKAGDGDVAKSFGDGCRVMVDRSKQLRAAAVAAAKQRCRSLLTSHPLAQSR